MWPLLSNLTSKYLYRIEFPDDPSIYSTFTNNEGALILCIHTVKAFGLGHWRSLLREWAVFLPTFLDLQRVPCQTWIISNLTSNTILYLRHSIWVLYTERKCECWPIMACGASLAKKEGWRSPLSSLCFVMLKRVCARLMPMFAGSFFVAIWLVF